jgi:hypothetical protein
MINTNINPFFIYRQPRFVPEEKNIAAFERKLYNLLERQDKILFNDVKATRSLKMLLLSVIGRVKKNIEEGHNDRENAIKLTEGLLGYLINQTDRIPHGIDGRHCRNLGYALRAELSELLRKPVRFGEGAARDTIEVLDLLLTRLEQADQQYRPRRIEDQPDELEVRRINTIAEFLPLQSRIAFSSVSRSIRSALSLQIDCWRAAATRFCDLNTFQFRLVSLDEPWACDPRLVATALESWARYLGQEKIPDGDVSMIFEALLNLIARLPPDYGQNAMLILIHKLPRLGWPYMDTILGMMEQFSDRPRAAILQSLAVRWEDILLYADRAGDDALKKFFRLLQLVNELSGASRARVLATMKVACRRSIWISVCEHHGIGSSAEIAKLLPKELLTAAFLGLGDEYRQNLYPRTRAMSALLEILGKVHQFNVEGYLSREHGREILKVLYNEVVCSWQNRDYEKQQVIKAMNRLLPRLR